MIKAVIFDYGEVISYGKGLKNICMTYATANSIEFKPFHKIVVENWRKAKVNEISSGQFWESLANYARKDVKKLREEFMGLSKIDERVVDLIRKVKKNYKTALISNHLEDWLEEDLDKNNLRNLFDVIVNSYHVKIAKPNPEIYLIADERLKVKPEECVFVDNKNSNVEGSRKVGMIGLECNSFEKIVDAFTTLGVRF